jgi:hypothetical protein
MADRLTIEDRATTRLATVVGGARRVDRQGRPADDAYYGYRGVACIPDGRHDAVSWLRHSLTGVKPWNLGSVAFARELLDEMGSFLRVEVGLCADLELLMRAAAYGDIEYIDRP